MTPVPNHDLCGPGMAKKVYRACGEAVGSRLQYAQQVSWLRLRQPDLASKRIDGCAKRSDDNHRRFVRGIASTQIDDRVITPNHLSEVARRSQMVVHAPVEHDESHAAAILDRSDARHVNAGWPGQKPAGLHHEAGLRDPRIGTSSVG